MNVTTQLAVLMAVAMVLAIAVGVVFRWVAALRERERAMDPERARRRRTKG